MKPSIPDPDFRLAIPPQPRHIHQRDGYSCGATCVEMLLQYLGIPLEIEEIKRLFNTNPETGTTHEGMIAGLTSLELPFERSVMVKNPFQWLDKHLKKSHLFLMRTRIMGMLHWILCYGKLKDKYLIVDPAMGYYRLTEAQVQERWEPRDWDGFAVLIKAKGEVVVRPMESYDDFLEGFIACYYGLQDNHIQMSLKSFMGTVLGGIRDDPKDSWVAYHGKEAVGAYFIGHRQITDLYNRQETDPYKGKRGIEGVALGVSPWYQGYGIGNILRRMPLGKPDIQYCWGAHLGCLNNLDQWVKFGRRHLFSMGGKNGTHVTLMDLEEGE